MAKSATRTPPKRTRRVSAPFDARLEVRMYSTEKAKLQEEAAARGMSASDLARFQLGDLIAAEPPKPTETPDPAPAALPDVPTDLVEAIAQALDCTPGHALLKLKLGKVTVAGETWSNGVIPSSLLSAVEVDGQPLLSGE